MIRYRNAETKITVISENESCLQCKKECNDRSRKDYLNYPYCIDCLTKMLIFTGKTEIQERVIPEKELLVELETKQEFICREK